MQCNNTNNMSAEHAGTRKWSKILKSHSSKSSEIDKVSELNIGKMVVRFGF